MNQQKEPERCKMLVRLAWGLLEFQQQIVAASSATFGHRDTLQNLKDTLISGDRIAGCEAEKLWKR
jgi:hypothetical protein